MLCLIVSSIAQSVETVADSSQQWRQKSEQGFFQVELTSAPRDTELNKFQIWHLVIQDAKSGTGITPVRVVVGGGMPAHGHGLPTQPQVTKHLGEGRYQLEGLKFNMAGQWQLIFDIDTGNLSDRVIFDLVIEH